jgi:hypothetical protein
MDVLDRLFNLFTTLVFTATCILIVIALFLASEWVRVLFYPLGD